MGQTLKSRFVNGVIWGFIDRFATLGIGFIITIFLARQLSPEDYGLINMLTIFTTLGTVLIDAGFGQALIQRQDTSRKQESTVFFFNIFLSLIIYVIGFFSAPLIANFYNQPQLVSISRVIFLLLPINAFGIIQHSILTKELKVRENVIATTTALLVGGFIGLFLAFKGMGVWSLVWQSISYAATRCLVLWTISKWSPVLSFDLTFIKTIFGFSINLLGVFTIAAIFQNIYPMIIGRCFPLTQVGYYSQAYRLQSTISGSITSAIQTVSFPTIASVQNDISKVRSMFNRMTTCLMFVYFPIIMLMCLMAHELFEVILTTKWLLSVPLFIILCLAESLTPMTMLTASVLKGLGKGRLYFWLEMGKRSLILLSIILSINYGINQMLMGYAITMTTISLTYLIITCVIINYKISSMIKELMPILLFTIIMLLAIIPVKIAISNPIISLLVCLPLAMVTYLIIAIIFKYPALNEYKTIIKKK